MLAHAQTRCMLTQDAYGVGHTVERSDSRYRSPPLRAAGGSPLHQRSGYAAPSVGVSNGRTASPARPGSSPQHLPSPASPMPVRGITGGDQLDFIDMHPCRDDRKSAQKLKSIPASAAGPSGTVVGPNIPAAARHVSRLRDAQPLLHSAEERKRSVGPPVILADRSHQRGRTVPAPDALRL